MTAEQAIDFDALVRSYAETTGMPRKYILSKKRVFERRRAEWLMRPDSYVYQPLYDQWTAGLQNDRAFYGRTKLIAVNRAVRYWVETS